MLRSKMMKGLIATIAVAVMATAAFATFSVYVSPGLSWKGQITWNSESGAVVNVRVQNNLATSVGVLVEVKARAEDGSTVSGQTILGLQPYQGREVAVHLPKPVTSLQLTQIRRIR